MTPSWLLLVPAAFTAFYYPLNFWTLEGMEVGALALITTMALTWALSQLETAHQDTAPPHPSSTAPTDSHSLVIPGVPGPFALYTLLGLGTLLRLDGAVAFVVIWLHQIWRLRGQPDQRRHLLTGATILTLCLGAQTTIRLWYYGDYLPNTYYLKMTGWPIFDRCWRGWIWLLQTMHSLSWLPVIAILIAALRKHAGALLLSLIFIFQCAYSVYVGGDAWEERISGSNRFISVAIPAAFVLTTWAARELVFGFRTKLPRRMAGVALGALGVYLLGPVNRTLFIDRPLDWQTNIDYVTAAYVFEDLTTPQATVAVVSAGVLPYFLDRTCFDILGKSDRVIAHGPARPPRPFLKKRLQFLPGHMKWDYHYTIGKLKPDVVPVNWGYSTVEEMQLLGLKHYANLRVGNFVSYLRRNSPLVKWNKVVEYVNRTP